MDWSQFPLAYAFPPAPILPRVLAKIKTDQARVILIAPAWAKQLWYPTILELLCDTPVHLPAETGLLYQQFQGLYWEHQNPGLYHYHAWPLSGRQQDRQDFLKQLPTTSPQHRLAL